MKQGHNRGHSKGVKRPALPAAAPQGRRHHIPPSSDTARPLPCNGDEPSCTSNAQTSNSSKSKDVGKGWD